MQIEDLTSLLLGGPPEDEAASSRKPATFAQAFVLGFSSLMLDLSSLHPTPDQVSSLWTFFANKVDIRFKILHKPTTQQLVLGAANQPNSVDKNIEPLLFSIYYASIANMSEDDCQTYLDESRDSLLTKYRFGTEQALTRAEFLVSAEVVILQALVLFTVSIS